MNPSPWTPPETVEEMLKRLLVPGGLYARYLHRKALRKGEREVALVPFLADRRRLALDIGANKGVYTYALLEHGCAVHAFEPNPKMFRILEGWARGRAVLHSAALGAEPGRAELMIPKTSSGYSNQGGSLSTDMIAGRAFGAVEVEVKTLDALGLADVGFMKIDVEGFELEVLRGARSMLARDRPVLLIEMEERHTRKPLLSMIDEVRGYGYRALALVGGVLMDLSIVDLARHADPQDRATYLFNFVFLPDG